ncbi:MAG: hypothetical protein JXR49_11905 [Acidobacteria bacterium]|nr:hypothetical protein [Acidobacteriota bacterium]
MCNQSEPINTYIIAIASAIIGGGIGAYFTFLSSKRMLYETRRFNALDRFIGAFIDEIVFIENSVPLRKSGSGYIIKPNSNISKILLQSRPKHRRAIENLRLYIDRKQYAKIHKAYEKYYNPLNIKEPQDIINKLSFGIYNMHAEEIKKNIKINRKISGKELALENINAIFNAAK